MLINYFVYLLLFQRVPKYQDSKNHILVINRECYARVSFETISLYLYLLLAYVSLLGSSLYFTLISTQSFQAFVDDGGG